MFGGLSGWLNQFYQQQQMPSGISHGGGYPPQPMQPLQAPDHMTPQMPPMQTGGPGQMQPLMGTGGPGQVQGLTANTGGITPPQPQMNTGGPGQVQGQHFGGLAGMFNRQQRGGGLRHMFGFGPDAR